jgi:hypothetical protein
LSENISKLLNTQQIGKYLWPVRTHIDYQIEVDVQRFETTSVFCLGQHSAPFVDEGEIQPRDSAIIPRIQSIS